MSEFPSPTVARRLRVALTNPFAWPQVRRGSERLLNDLACHLHDAGHCVSVFAMGPEDGTEVREGVTYRFIRERWRTSLRQINSLHYFALRLQRPLAQGDFDLVYCLHHADAYAALRSRQRYGARHKVIFQTVGIPDRRFVRATPLDRRFLQRALAESDTALVLSQHVRRTVEREFGVACRVLPPPVATQNFHGVDPAPSDPGPLLLFVGDVDEPRKGADLLCRAFVELKADWPFARLRFVGRASAGVRNSLLAQAGVHAPSVEFSGLGQTADLPAHFAHADVTVLPAVNEAFGLVLVESLASGTPVVGARHGGIPDVIQGELVGALFEPGDFDRQSHAVEALVPALRSVLRRGKTGDVVEACRARAELFSWSTLGARYRHLIETVAAKGVSP